MKLLPGSAAFRAFFRKVPVVDHTIRFFTDLDGVGDLYLNVGDTITVEGRCTVFIAADRVIELYFPPLTAEQATDRSDRHLMDEYGVEIQR